MAVADTLIAALLRVGRLVAASEVALGVVCTTAGVSDYIDMSDLSF
jgi:hypothetical protein